MRWLAIVPLKGRGERKTRLADHLTAPQRDRLTQMLFAHVVDVLAKVPEIDEVAVLCDLRPAGFGGRVIADAGRGLNGELTAMAQTEGARPVLVMHADLPLVSVSDVAALLAASADGCAIAPDRHGAGTNALALLDAAAFNFQFGIGSFALHAVQAKGRARVVTRPGLALDIDTADDLAAAVAAGFAFQ